MVNEVHFPSVKVKLYEWIARLEIFLSVDMVMTPDSNITNSHDNFH